MNTQLLLTVVIALIALAAARPQFIEKETIIREGGPGFNGGFNRGPGGFNQGPGGFNQGPGFRGPGGFNQGPGFARGPGGSEVIRETVITRG